MILNTNKYPRIFHNHVEYSNIPKKTWSMKNYNDRDYWYADIQDDVNFLNIIPQEIIEKLNSGSVTLIVETCLESHLFIVENVYRYLVKPNIIKASNISILSDNRNIEFEVNKVFADSSERPEVCWCLSFESATRYQIRNDIDIFKHIHTLEKKQYIKKFLNFNRRWRLHRPVAVALLCAKNLLEYGYVSLAKINDNGMDWEGIFPEVVECLKDNDVLKNLVTSNKNKILSLPNLYLDTKRLDINLPRLIEKGVDFNKTKLMYENTYFSLVNETEFFNSSSIFFTEKTFKPIAFKHPFVLISSPNQLKWLRTLGYKTFHPFINENYDLETNDANRMKMIIDEVERLSTLSDAEVDSFIDNVKPIVEYNFKVLTDKTNFGHRHQLIG